MVKTTYTQRMDQALNYVKNMNIPKDTQDRVRTWFIYNWQQQKVIGMHRYHSQWLFYSRLFNLTLSRVCILKLVWCIFDDKWQFELIQYSNRFRQIKTSKSTYNSFGIRPNLSNIITLVIQYFDIFFVKSIRLKTEKVIHFMFFYRRFLDFFVKWF